MNSKTPSAISNLKSEISDPILSVHHITKSFGGLHAVKEISFELKRHEILSVIGPNGAGKTTLFNCMTGMYRASSGTVVLFRHGKPLNVTDLPPHDISRAGMARTFQNIRLFPHMTALENVMVGRFAGTRSGVWAGILRTAASVREDLLAANRAHELLEFVGVEGQANALAAHLPYGDKRRVELARALASDPGIVLLDEPAAGMNPRETEGLTGLIERIKTLGIAVILIEHDMKVVMGISDRIIVLNYGESIAEGTPKEICCHPRVIEAYLGEPGNKGRAVSDE